jgi:UDP-N-acetylmuramoylalanine--D-glutamate ligase
MRLKNFAGRKTAIWGTGREGCAAAAYILSVAPDADIRFLDEKPSPPVRIGERSFPVIADADEMARELQSADILVKSPGVSLYHEKLKARVEAGKEITSLLNMWFAENAGAFVVGVTGTKGKSTTATLLSHVLSRLGVKNALAGNIGLPISEEKAEGPVDVHIVEVSSYQAANFTGLCEIGVLTSLYPEHLNWHGSLSRYFADKTNLLRHSKKRILALQAIGALAENGIELNGADLFGGLDGMHAKGLVYFDGDAEIGKIENEFLARPHNLSNVAAVLAVAKEMKLDLRQALAAMADYRGLPHRQQEIASKNGILFVDDSISTTPQSALAAMEVYRDRPLTLIVGGFDRGVDYAAFIEHLAQKAHAVACLGQTGAKIFEALQAKGKDKILKAATMDEAVLFAARETPTGGAILLSPAAPSFDMFKDYEDRARAFGEAVANL